ASDPYWMGLCRLSAGNIALIIAPMQGSDLFADAERSRRAINRAIAFAGRLGARCVALTGLIPSATDLGQALDPPDGVVLTTGHAATASAVALTVASAAQSVGRDLRDEMV